MCLSRPICDIFPARLALEYQSFHRKCSYIRVFASNRQDESAQPYAVNARREVGLEGVTIAIDALELAIALESCR
jgi:hypothetical protein